MNAPDKTVTLSGRVTAGNVTSPANVTLTIADDDPPPPPSPGPTGPTGPPPTRTNVVPSFTDGASATRNVVENTVTNTDIGSPVAARDTNAGDRLTYALIGADAGSFDLDASTGQLKTKAALDFETMTNYSVTVSVHDGKNDSGGANTTVDDTIAVTITVTNVAEIGDNTLSPQGVPTIRTTITATLSDADGGVAGVAWQWQRSADTSTWTCIQGAASESYVPRNSDAGMRLRAKVTYDDRAGTGIELVSAATEPVPAPAAAPSPSRATTTTFMPTQPSAPIPDACAYDYAYSNRNATAYGDRNVSTNPYHDAGAPPRRLSQPLTLCRWRRPNRNKKAAFPGYGSSSR